MVAALVFAADQLTKQLALHDLASGSHHLIGPLSLELEFNTGVAFSLGSGFGSVIVVIVVMVLLALLVLGRAVPGRLGAVGFGLVLGGALGNLFDRLFRSTPGVVDFIHTSFWPTFNVGDSAVVIGVIVLAIGFLRDRPAEEDHGLGDQAGRDRSSRGQSGSDQAGSDQAGRHRE